MKIPSAIICMLLSIVCLCFLGCKKGDDANNSIIGTWELHHLKVTLTDHTISPPSVSVAEDTTYSAGTSNVWEFRSNNVYVFRLKRSAPVLDSGSYDFRNNSTLSITSVHSSTPDTEQISIQGASFITTSDETKAGHETQIVWTYERL